MKPKTKISSCMNGAKLEVSPAEESTNIGEKIMEDSSQLTDEEEKPVDTPNQVHKFFDILNESLIFGDVPENENRLETFLVDLPFKTEEVSDLDEGSFAGAKTISSVQNFTAGSQIYRSYRGYSKLQKVSEDLIEKTISVHSDTKNNKKGEAYSKLPNVSDEITYNHISLPSETAKNNKKRSKRCSKLPNVSEETNNNANTLLTETGKNNKKSKIYSKLLNVSDEITENSSTFPTETIKKTNKESKKVSKLPNEWDEITENAYILHTDNLKSFGKDKAHSKLSNVSDHSTKTAIILHTETVKNNKDSKDNLKLPNVSVDTLENANTLHTEIVKNNRKGHSKLPNEPNEIENTTRVHSNIKNIRKKGKIYSTLPNIANSLIEKANTQSTSIKNCWEKSIVQKHATSVMTQNGNNAVISQSEFVKNSSEVTEKVKISQTSEFECNTSKFKRALIVTFPGTPEELQLCKKSIDSKIIQIVKSLPKYEDISDAVNTSTLHKEILLESDAKNASINEAIREHNSDILSDPISNIQTKHILHITEALIKDNRMQPIVPLADVLKNREVFKSQKKDEGLAEINKVYSSPEFKVNTDNSDKSNMITDGRQSSAESIRPLKRSSRLKIKAENKIKSLTYKPVLMDNKVVQISDLAKSNEIGVTRFDMNSAQDVNNNITNDNSHVLRYPGKKCVENSYDVHKRSVDKVTGKYVSSSKPSLILSYPSNEIDISEKPCPPEDMEECSDKNSKISLFTTPTRQTRVISKIPISANETINVSKNNETSSPCGRKTQSFMDMFKRYTSNVLQTSEHYKCLVDQKFSDYSLSSDSHQNIIKAPKQVKKITKALSPRCKAGLNDKTSLDKWLQNTPKNSKHTDSMNLHSTPNEESGERRRSVAKAKQKGKSSSRNQSPKSSVGAVATSSSNNVTDSKMLLKGYGLESILPVPSNLANNSGDNILFSKTEPSHKQSQNRKKKHRNTISNILNRRQTRTVTSFQISDISPIKNNIVKIKNYFPLQNEGENVLSKKNKRSQSGHRVSDSVCTEKETIASKTVSMAHIKGNQSSSTFDPSIEPTSAKRRKRCASVEPKLIYLQNSETVSSEENHTSGKRKLECLNKCKSYSVSDSSGADYDVTATNNTCKVNQNSSIFDSCTPTTFQAKRRKRTAPMKPKSCLFRSEETTSNEGIEPSGENQADYSPKNKELKGSISLEPRSDLNPFTDTGLEKKNVRGKKKQNSRLKDKMSIKIQQVCSQNTRVPRSVSLLPEEPNISNEQNDKDGSNSENKYLDTEVSDNYLQFQPTPTNQQNGYSYIPVRHTNMPIFNAGNNAFFYGNPVLQVPQHMNQQVVPYAYVNQFNPFPSPHSFYTFPVFQSRFPVQPSNFLFNNSSNMSVSNPSTATEPNSAVIIAKESNAVVNTATESNAAVNRATESNAAVNPQNIPNLSNTNVSKGRVKKVIIQNTNVLSASLNTDLMHFKHSRMTKFDETRENIVQNLRKKCRSSMCKRNENYFSEKPSSIVTVQRFCSNPLVQKKYQRKICDQIHNFDVVPKVVYKFDDDFFESPLREVIKDYVDCHLKAFVYKAPASKDHFITLAFNNFTFLDSLYFCEALPTEDRDLNSKDLISYLSSAAILSILDEYKRRELL